MLTITTRDLRVHVPRRDLPAAVLLPAEQRGEARARVEPRPTEPIDRPVARDERRRLAIADHRVIFDATRHADLRPGRRRCSHALATMLAGSSSTPRRPSAGSSLTAQAGSM